MRGFIAILFALVFLMLSEKSQAHSQLLVAALNYQVAELYSKGDYEKAIPLAQRVVTLMQDELGQDSPQVGIALDNLALLYRSLDRNREAETIVKRSLAIYEKAHGLEHAKVAVTLGILAELYQAQGQVGKAQRANVRRLAIVRKEAKKEAEKKLLKKAAAKK